MRFTPGTFRLRDYARIIWKIFYYGFLSFLLIACLNYNYTDPSFNTTKYQRHSIREGSLLINKTIDSKNPVLKHSNPPAEYSTSTTNTNTSNNTNNINNNINDVNIKDGHKALSSFSSSNSNNSNSNNKVSNITGKFGAYCASAIFNLFGFIGYLLLILLYFKSRISLRNFILFCIIFLILAILLSLFAVSDKWLSASYGGVIGFILHNILHNNFAIKDYNIALVCILAIIIIFLNIIGILTSVKIKRILLNYWARITAILFGVKVSVKQAPGFIKHKEFFLNEGEQEELTHIEITEKDPWEEEPPTLKRDLLYLENDSINLNSNNNCNKDNNSNLVNDFNFNNISSLNRINSLNNFKNAAKNININNRNINSSFKNAVAIKPVQYFGSIIPPLHFLSQQKEIIKQHDNNIHKGQLLESVLGDFKIDGKIVEISVGPVVTLFELQPAAGTKSSKVISLATDIARTMSAISARISIIPGRNVLGIELPNSQREIVLLRELLESDIYKNSKLALPIALGKSINGSPIVVDLAKMPHLLVAGTTGSGKSVAINAMILSIIYRLTPEECRLILIDPKMLELSIYDDIPHLLSPVVTEPKKAVIALKWVTKEMEKRYKLMSKLSVRSLENYNQKAQQFEQFQQTFKEEKLVGIDPTTGEKIFETIETKLDKMPLIVVIVDEMADLMLVAGKDIEVSIQRLAQMARAAGIHIIMATQRPSVDVITGVIKANFPTRISFAVTSKIDSRTILGEQGAEQLLGRGDMLYMAAGSGITRIHGPFVSDLEVENITTYLKQCGSPQYNEEITLDEECGAEDEGQEGNDSENGDDFSSLYEQAIDIIKRDNKVSISYLQRKLSIGYNKAAKIVEQMEKEGLVSSPNHSGKRVILKN